MNDGVKGVAATQPGRFATTTDPGRPPAGAPASEGPRPDSSGKGLPPAADPATTQDSLRRATRQINAYLARVDRDLRFRVDDATGIVVVRVIDARTQELVRQIPAETVLRLAARLQRSGRLDTTGLDSRA